MNLPHEELTPAEFETFLDEQEAHPMPRPKKPEHSKYADRIKRLKRRAEWLRSQADSTRADIHYTRAELSALEWAVPILENYAQAEYKRFRTPLAIKKRGSDE